MTASAARQVNHVPKALDLAEVVELGLGLTAELGESRATLSAPGGVAVGREGVGWSFERSSVDAGAIDGGPITRQPRLSRVRRAISARGRRPDNPDVSPNLDDHDRFIAALASFLGGTVAVLPLLAGLIDAWTFLSAALLGSLGILPIWRHVGAPLTRPLPFIAFAWLFIVGPAIVIRALSLLAFWTYLGAWVFTLGVLRFVEGSAASVVHEAEAVTARTDSGQFDADLSALVDEFNDVLHVGHETRPEGAARERLKARATDVATRTRALSPPDPAWREVHDDFVELMSLHLAHFGEVLPEAVQRRFAAISQRVNLRWEELRNVHRQQDQ